VRVLHAGHDHVAKALRCKGKPTEDEIRRPFEGILEVDRYVKIIDAIKSVTGGR